MLITKNHDQKSSIHKQLSDKIVRKGILSLDAEQFCGIFRYVLAKIECNYHSQLLLTRQDRLQTCYNIQSTVMSTYVDCENKCLNQLNPG